MVRNTKLIGGLLAALILLGAGVLLFRPRVMPPPEAGTPAADTVAGQRAASRPSASWPRTFTDALGNQVTLAGPARRIVTMSPNLAEIVCALDASEALVGVDDFTKYPPAVAAKAKIGGIINPDLERILALTPDLVLISRGLDKPLIEKLKSLKLPIFATDPRNLEQVRGLIRQVGELCGRPAEAARLVDSLAARQEAVRLEARARPPVRVLLAVAWDGLFVAGATSFAGDLIRTAGGDNVVARMQGIDPQKPWPNVTRELVVLADPQLLVFAGKEAAPVPGGAEATLRWLRQDQGWAGLSAVRTGQVTVIDQDLLTIPGPRLWDGLEKLAEAIGEAGRGSQGR
jgi:iron complex transport system substrate-binding protein